jgi:ABC-type amino acid transport substrate-binding protein
MAWRASAVAAVLIFVVSGWADAKAPQRVPTLEPGVLRVGTYFVNPPFEYVSDGRKVGFEVDLIREIARRLHLKPMFVNTRWEVILQQMQEGRYDCIVGGITITPIRQVTLAWSDPYMTTTLSLIINSAKTPQIRSLADLKDAEVGVQAATTDYDVAVAMQRRGEIGKVKVYTFDLIADAMTDLGAGRITAVMKIYPVAAWLARRSPDLRIVAQIPNDPQPLGIGLNKNNPELLAAVNGALSEMKQDRTYARLARKWDVP